VFYLLFLLAYAYTVPITFLTCNACHAVLCGQLPAGSCLHTVQLRQVQLIRPYTACNTWCVPACLSAAACL
jgi:hypothetical protein